MPQSRLRRLARMRRSAKAVGPRVADRRKGMPTEHWVAHQDGQGIIWLIYHSTRTFNLSEMAIGFTIALPNCNYWLVGFVLAVAIDLGLIDERPRVDVRRKRGVQAFEETSKDSPRDITPVGILDPSGRGGSQPSNRNIILRYIKDRHYIKLIGIRNWQIPNNKKAPQNWREIVDDVALAPLSLL